MKAMLEPRIVAASTHFPEARAHGVLAASTWMTFSSQGSRIDAITPQSKMTERSTTTAVEPPIPDTGDVLVDGPIAQLDVHVWHRLLKRAQKRRHDASRHVISIQWRLRSRTLAAPLMARGCSLSTN